MVLPALAQVSAAQVTQVLERDNKNIGKIDVSTVSEHNEALNKAVTGATLDLIKVVPIVGQLVSGIERYKSHLEKLQQESFVYSLAEKLAKVESELVEGITEFWKKDENQDFVKKTVASAMNAEYAEKIDFFVNALINGALLKTGEMERLKFVELVRNASRPALAILAELGNFPHVKNKTVKYDERVDSEITLNQLVEQTGQEKDLVRANVKELDGLGIFVSHYASPEKPHATVGPFARKFIEFIQDPVNKKP